MLVGEPMKASGSAGGRILERLACRWRASSTGRAGGFYGGGKQPETEFRIPRLAWHDSRSLAGGVPQPLQFGLERGVRPFGVVSVG